MEQIQRNNKVHFERIISNKVLSYLLSDESTRELNEYGVILSEKKIKFIINSELGYEVFKNAIYKSIGGTELGKLTFFLQFKYNVEFDIVVGNKKFTNVTINNCVSYYSKPLECINKTIFKYYRINDNFLKSLVGDYFWFSDPNDFNDPFDCRPKFEIEVSSDNIIQFYYDINVKLENIKNVTKDEFLKTFNIPSKQIFNKHLEEYHFQRTFSNTGIACFTEEYDNKLMWDHYADGYRGICMVLDLNILKENFMGDNLFKGYKVKYADLKPRMYFDGTGEIDISSLFFTKLPEYKYEKEIREVVSFQSKEVERRVKFNPKALKAILFGYKSSESDKQTIKNIIQNKPHYSHVNFIETQIDIDSNKVKILDDI